MPTPLTAIPELQRESLIRPTTSALSLSCSSNSRTSRPASVVSVPPAKSTTVLLILERVAVQDSWPADSRS